MTKPLTDRIEHVVVLMLENRSFDNVLGGLYPELSKQGLYRGLLGTETNPLDPRNKAAGSVTVFTGPATSSIWIMPYPDPGELYSDMVQQLFGTTSVPSSACCPPMSGFAWNYSGQPPSVSGPGWPSVPPVPRNIMQYYSGDAMPVTTCLAKQYAVCDIWFAAAPVQTLANRVLTHCGTPSRQPKPNSNKSRIDNPDYAITLPYVPPVDDKTIFELLDDAYPKGKAPECGDPASRPLNWKVYHHDVPASALCKYVWDHWCVDDLFGGNVFDFYEHFSDKTNFEYDIKHGLLPKYSFIEPYYSDELPGSIVNSNHPGGAGVDWADENGLSLPPPINVMAGERLLHQVYDILLKHLDVFNKTLLIVTYDEHGGLFDHVPPPCAVSPFKPAVENFNYDRYGVRVPVILINPSIKPGTIYPERKPGAPVPLPPFDHTSILSTLVAQFGLTGSLSPRVDSAPKLNGLIPASDALHPRPPCPAPAPPAVTPSPPRPPVTNVPRNARTLAGALAPLYRRVQASKRRPRPRP